MWIKLTHVKSDFTIGGVNNYIDNTYRLINIDHLDNFYDVKDLTKEEQEKYANILDKGAKIFLIEPSSPFKISISFYLETMNEIHDLIRK